MYAPTPPTPPLLLSSLNSSRLNSRPNSRPTSARHVRPSSSVINSMPRPPPLSTSAKIPRVNSAPFPMSNLSRRGLEAGSSQPQLQFPPHPQQLQIKHQLAVPHTALALVQKNNPTNFSNAESILSSPAPYLYEPPGVSPSTTFSSIPSRTTSITTSSVKKKKHQSDGNFYGWTWKEEKERQHKSSSICSSPPSSPSSRFPATTTTTTITTTTAAVKPRRSARAATVGQPPRIDTTGRNTMVGNISGDTTTSGDIDAGLESLSSASSSTETSVETPETGKKLIDQIPPSSSFTYLNSSTATAMLNMPKYNATTGNLSRRSQLVWQQEEEEEEDKPLKRRSFIVKLWKSLSRKKK